MLKQAIYIYLISTRIFKFLSLPKIDWFLMNLWTNIYMHVYTYVNAQIAAFFRRRALQISSGIAI